LKSAEEEFQKIADAVRPQLPEDYNPSDTRESAIDFLMPNYNYWNGIDAGTSSPVANASLLETNLAVSFHPVRHPYQPGSYIAVLEASPVVPAGVPHPREEASLHVLRGKY
jgi:hypothetical protein